MDEAPSNPRKDSGIEMLTESSSRSNPRRQFLKAGASESSGKLDEIALEIAKTENLADIVRKWGYGCDEHHLMTSDGVVLTAHRIIVDSNISSAEKKPPVLLWPGFTQTSAAFVCSVHHDSNIAFVLAEAGLDVWLGNPRGPMYTDFGSASRYFTIDHIAQKDIPAVVGYILETTRHKSLTYIGISQGTCSVFGALAVSENLNEKIHLVIALAPTLKPLESAIASFVYPLFWKIGTKLHNEMFMMGSTLVKKIVPAAIQSRCVSLLCYIAFDWDFDKIGAPSLRVPLGLHGITGTSRGVVEHWFQTIISGTSFSSFVAQRKLIDIFNHVEHVLSPVKYPTKHICTKLVLMYSPKDAITDIEQLKAYLPSHAEFVEIPEYEHFEFLWGKNVKKVIFERVLEMIIKST